MINQDTNRKIEKFKKIHKKKELYWDLCWIGLMLGSVIFAEFQVWEYYSSEDKLIAMICTPFIVVGVFLAIVRPVDSYLRRTALKEYWIEDHGEVIKLFGSVYLMDMNHAYRDILKVRPGFKIVSDAYPKYGCTLAAIKATQADLDAKSKLEEMGFTAHTIA